MRRRWARGDRAQPGAAGRARRPAVRAREPPGQLGTLGPATCSQRRALPRMSRCVAVATLALPCAEAGALAAPMQGCLKRLKRRRRPRHGRRLASAHKSTIRTCRACRESRPRGAAGAGRIEINLRACRRSVSRRPIAALFKRRLVQRAAQHRCAVAAMRLDVSRRCPANSHARPASFAVM